MDVNSSNVSHSPSRSSRSMPTRTRSHYINSSDWADVLAFSVLDNKKDYTGNASRRLTQREIIKVLQVTRNLNPDFIGHITLKASATETRSLLKRVLDQGTHIFWFTLSHIYNFTVPKGLRSKLSSELWAHVNWATLTHVTVHSIDIMAYIEPIWIVSH